MERAKVCTAVDFRCLVEAGGCVEWGMGMGKMNEECELFFGGHRPGVGV